MAPTLQYTDRRITPPSAPAGPNPALSSDLDLSLVSDMSGSEKSFSHVDLRRCQ